MKFLEAIGGMSGMLDLAKNPQKVPELLAKSTPGAVHTLGRMRLLQEISGRSAILTSQCHNMLAMCLIEKRDVSEAEIEGINKLELQLLEVCKRLNSYPSTAAGVNLEILKEVYGVGTQFLEASGNEGNKKAGV